MRTESPEEHLPEPGHPDSTAGALCGAEFGRTEQTEEVKLILSLIEERTPESISAARELILRTVPWGEIREVGEIDPQVSVAALLAEGSSASKVVAAEILRRHAEALQLKTQELPQGGEAPPRADLDRALLLAGEIFSLSPCGEFVARKSEQQAGWIEIEGIKFGAAGAAQVAHFHSPVQPPTHVYLDRGAEKALILSEERGRYSAQDAVRGVLVSLRALGEDGNPAILSRFEVQADSLKVFPRADLGAVIVRRHLDQVIRSAEELQEIALNAPEAKSLVMRSHKTWNLLPEKGPIWPSPEGDLLLELRDYSKLTISAPTGKKLDLGNLTNPILAPSISAAFSQDGGRLAIGGVFEGAKKIYLYTVAREGEEIKLVPQSTIEKPSRLGPLKFSPDGSVLAVTDRSTGASLYRIKGAGEAPEAIEGIGEVGSNGHQMVSKIKGECFFTRSGRLRFLNEKQELRELRIT